MNPRFAAACLSLATLAAAPRAGIAAQCTAESGARTAALVELYTSEGCSSCPPADRQLGMLPAALDPGALAVPLALHVAYWDDLGWKDPFAHRGFDERQRSLARANGMRSVYTPGFFVSGTEARRWPAALRESVRAVNARPAAATLRVRSQAIGADRLVLDVHASTSPERAGASLYVAVTESGLASKVARGENGGATLAHDHVVRTLIGPIALAHGEVAARREIALPAAWRRERLGVVAFVQDARDGSVLQALSAPACTRA